jgi:hypothetical protein
MFIFIALVLGLYMFLIFRKYRDIPSVVIAVVSIFVVTTAILLRGVFVFSASDSLAFFNQNLHSAEFYHLMAIWYAGNILCSLLIIRRYRAYRKINVTRSGNGKSG